MAPRTSLSDAKRRKGRHLKDDKKVAKKDGKLLPCLIVYSLIQKRERVAHYLSVFIIVIIYFDKTLIRFFKIAPVKI